MAPSTVKQQQPNDCPTSTSSDPYSSENLDKTLAEARQEYEQRHKRSQRAECLQLTADLVEWFGTTVILPNLPNHYKGSLKFKNWHTDLRNYIMWSFCDHLEESWAKQIDELILAMERIAVAKGLTRVQWYNLINLNINMEVRNETSCSGSEKLGYIKKLAKEVFEEPHLWEAVHALIEAIPTKDADLAKPRRVVKAKRHCSDVAKKTAPLSNKLLLKRPKSFPMQGDCQIPLPMH